MDAQSTQERASSLTAPDVPATAADREPVVTSDVPPEAPAMVVPRPDQDITSLPAEIAEKYLLDEAWAWATGVEREEFVAQHRSELKKIIAKIERREARAS